MLKTVFWIRIKKSRPDPDPHRKMQIQTVSEKHWLKDIKQLELNFFKYTFLKEVAALR